MNHIPSSLGCELKKYLSMPGPGQKNSKEYTIQINTASVMHITMDFRTNKVKGSAHFFFQNIINWNFIKNFLQEELDKCFKNGL